jgi:HK97 family phage major capsid protein
MNELDLDGVDRDAIATANAQVDAMTPHERAARRAQVVGDIARLDGFARRSRSQQAQLDGLQEEFSALLAADAEAEVDRARRRDHVARAALVPSNCEAGSYEGAAAAVGSSGRQRGSSADPTLLARHRTAAYDGIARAETLGHLGSDELLRRADSALEILSARGVPDEGVARLAEMLEEPDREEWGALYPAAVAERKHAAAQTLALSDPAYRSAFAKVIRSPLHFSLDLTDEERYAMARTRAFVRDVAGDSRDWQTAPMGDYSARAALSLTGANGGFLVPFTLDPAIMLTNAGSANPWRAWATIKQTTTNDWNGVSSAGVTAAWLAEGIESADNTPTVAQTKITPAKAAAYVYGSYEVLDDSDFAEQLPMILADAKDRLEETAFATGSGSGQPFGAVTRATATALGGGAITAAGVYSLHQALPARFRLANGRPGWFGNVVPLDALRQLPVFTGSQSPMLAGTTMAPFGEPAYESSSMDGVISTGGHKVLLYGDGGSYLIVDRIGMTLVYDPVVKGVTNQRPTGQAGWYGFWRVGADSSVAGASTALRTLSLT